GALADPDETGEVDRWAHYINVHMLDRDGHRINRRNPQDIFTPLYDHQIPPGAAATVHYRLDIPTGTKGPVDLRVRVRYRKFDQEYMQLVYKDKPVPKLPIVDICEDRVKLPVAGSAEQVERQTSPIQPAWQRWNDYGIGCFLEGGGAPTGLSNKRGEMKQARAAFQHLIDSGEKEAVAHGWLNLARVLIDDVDLAAATHALNKASEAGAYWWTVAWFKGMVAAENATKREDFDVAVKLFQSLLEEKNQPVDRGFDFRQDYVLLDMLGKTLFKRSQLERDDPKIEVQTLLQAIEVLEKVLAI